MPLLVRRVCWTLSGWAKLILVATVGLGGWFGMTHVYPFLSPTHRITADVLVVEGWIHEYAIRAAAQELTTGGYRRIVTTGGPVEGSGGYTNDFNTSASVGAGRLRNAGVPSNQIAMAPARFAARDRTYASAVGLRRWLAANAPEVKRINVVTADAHARRTQLLFRLALGPDVEVGVISIPSPDYDARRWWESSEGVRTVLGETVSYAYAKLLFTAPESTSTAAFR